jgi:dimethylargininase
MRALVRAVPDTLADGELTYLERQPVDVSVARGQHRAYRALLASLGVDVVELPPLPDHPDSVFVEDVLVVVDDLAIITRPGAPSRRGEIVGLRAALEPLGLRVAELAAPATLDGGDVLQIEDTLYVGRTTRTNAAAHAQLAALVEPLGRRVVPVDVTGCLHLKTAAGALPDGALLYVDGWVDATAFGDRPAIAVPEPSGADVLLVGDVVVLLVSAPLTRELISERGFRTEPIDLSELEKVEAGPTCPSVLLRG